MESSIETIYVLENPERNIIRFATGSQLKYADIIKEVFGVSCINDVLMMMQYNRCFQESVCKKYNLHANKLSISNIIRVASKKEILQLKAEMIENRRLEMQAPPEEIVTIPRPFDSIIKLQDGIFNWSEKSSSYILVQ